MDRRHFLQSFAAGAAVTRTLLQQSELLAAEAEKFDSSPRQYGNLSFQQTATDRYELRHRSTESGPLRILQITDTHFHPGDDSNNATGKMLENLVSTHRPDLIVHTGDFVNNDSKKAVDWTGLDILNGLGVPWALCFGNHDYPVNNAPGSLPLDEIRTRMKNGFQGYTDSASGRNYCYRHDVYRGDNPVPDACLFYFQVGYATGDRKISLPQLEWFQRQIEQDREKKVTAPITVFVHIPLKEYDALYASGKAIGVKAEDVCFDSDTGESFGSFQKSGRVVGVFCGHDHVNNYHGDWHGVDLTYGRVSGLGAYGPPEWIRGGRLISLDLAAERALPKNVEVF